MSIIVAALCVAFLIVCLLIAFNSDSAWVFWPFLIAALASVPLTVRWWSSTDTAKAAWAAEEARTRADMQPRVIREADGCKVYAFKGGDHWHYFTRCPNSTTKTDTTVSVGSGKTRHTETRSIEVTP